VRSKYNGPKGRHPTVHLPSAASTSLMMSFRFCHLRLKCQEMCTPTKTDRPLV
jgi:hypothetical protein